MRIESCTVCVRKLSGDRRSEAGFTIIEVLIAIGILAFGILAVASLQVTAIRGNASAKYQTEQNTWAQDKLEDLMTRTYAHADLDPAANPHEEASPPAGYTITWSVTDATPVAGSKLIAVTIAGNGKTTTLIGVKPQF
ncbi:MAG: prepilin-type N-terminal cleavage/methylation domain-containing protein [Desulfobacteraceae bacterium]|nr:MAG: prepilin-type N-terminal cleavage/methylation domain-containing protein [Desulfobacteraceae bacterium]